MSKTRSPFKVGDVVFFKVDPNRTLMCVESVTEHVSGIKIGIIYEGPGRNKICRQTVNSGLLSKALEWK